MKEVNTDWNSQDSVVLFRWVGLAGWQGLVPLGTLPGSVLVPTTHHARGTREVT